MYRINVSNENQIKKFLSINDTEYIDAIINGKNAILINNSREIFAALTLDAIAIDERELLQIRIPRKLLNNLVTVGYFLVKIIDTQVQLEFFEDFEGDTEKSCSVRYPKQDIWSMSYKEKLEIISNIDSSMTYDISSLSNLVKVGTINKSIIDCNNGIASISINSNCKIYRRVTSAMDFSISASALSVLMKVSSEVFDYQNYLGVSISGFTILCTKARGNSNEEYTLIQDERSSCIADVDLRYLQRFLSKIKVDNEVFSMNLDDGVTEIDSSSRNYTLPIMVRNLQKSTDKPCIINITKSVLEVLDKVCKGDIVKLYNKRTFVLLDGSESSIIYRS